MRPPEPNNDRGLVAKAKKGHLDAFKELVRRQQRSIYALCHRLIGAPQTADDPAPETFIKAYFNLAHFVDGLDFYPWIRQNTIDGCLNLLKKGKRERPLREEGHSTRPDVFGAPDELPQKTIERTESERKFQEVYNALPPD